VGDRIEEHQNLVDVMTDKATVEMTSPVTGVVLSLHGAPGEMATVGAPLVELDVEGAGNAQAIPAPAPSHSTPKPERVSTKPKPDDKNNSDTNVISLSAAGGEGQSAATRKSDATPAFATRAAGAKPLA